MITLSGDNCTFIPPIVAAKLIVNPIANTAAGHDHVPMNNQPDMPPLSPAQQAPRQPAPSLWSTWPSVHIFGLAVALMAGDFVMQIIFFSVGGGLFLPVLLGTVGGVFVPLYLLARNANLPARYDFSLWWRQPLIMVASALMAVTALAPTSLLAQLSTRLHPPTPSWTAFMNESMPEGTPAIILAFFTVVIAAPLAEELIFRGLLQRLFARAWGPWPAIIVSALIFGIIHGEPWYLFGLIGIGVVLAVVYEATGSVLACWITHMVHNGISLAMMIWSDQPTDEVVPLTTTDWAIAAGSLVLLVLLSRFLLQTRPLVTARKNPDQQ